MLVEADRRPAGRTGPSPVEALAAVPPAAVLGAPPDDVVELRSLAHALWRWRWLPVLLALAGAAAAGLAVSRLTPLYAARASVMLDPTVVRVLPDEEVVADVALSSALLDTEAAFMRSNTLLGRVARRIGPEALAPLDRPEGEPGRLGRAAALARARVAAWLGREAAPAAPPDDGLTPAERQDRRLVTLLRRSLTVAREGQSYVISVSAETVSPALSADIANAVVEAFIAAQGEARTGTIRLATAWLEGRVEEMRGEVEAAEGAVEQFKVDQLAREGASPETLAQQLLDLNTQLALAGAERATAEARLVQAQAAGGADAAGAAEAGLRSPALDDLRAQLAALRREDAALAARLGPAHPGRARLAAGIRGLLADLDAERAAALAAVEGDVAVARIREESLRASLAALEARAAAVSRSSLALRQLEREAEALRGAYEAALARLSETRSAERLQQPGARAVERATPSGAPSAPRPLLFASLGGAAGLSAGLVASLLLAFAGAGFAQAGQLGRAVGLPVLASIPWARPGPRGRFVSRIRTEPNAPFVERIRQLRTALLLRHEGAGARSVLVTSSLRSEGKTTVALGLAQLAALGGQRSLLLDLDLRRSSIARDLRLRLGRDLAAHLRGDCALEDAIHREARLGFDLVTLAEPQPRLVDRLDVRRLRAMIEALKARYDLVIIDAPPILAVSDASTFARVADSCLFLVRQGRTSRRAVADAIGRLAEAGDEPDGLVMTMVDPRTEIEAYGRIRPYGARR